MPSQPPPTSPPQSPAETRPEQDRRLGGALGHKLLFFMHDLTAVTCKFPHMLSNQNTDKDQNSLETSAKMMYNFNWKNLSNQP